MADCIRKHRHNLVKRLYKQYNSIKPTQKPSRHPVPTVGFCYLYIECPCKLSWGRGQKKHTQSCGITSLNSTGHSRLCYQSPEIRSFSENYTNFKSSPSRYNSQWRARGSQTLRSHLFTDRLTMVLPLLSTITVTPSKQSRKTKQSSRRSIQSTPQNPVICHQGRQIILLGVKQAAI